MKCRSLSAIFRIVVLITCLMAMFMQSVLGQGISQVADKVLKNAFVYTVDNERSQAEAVALKDGKIIYVGTNAGVKDFVGSETEVLDLKGKMVLPGFIDSHNHFSWGAVRALPETAHLNGLTSENEYLKVIQKFVKANPNLKVIKGEGWSNTLFPPTGPSKEALDEISKDIPISIGSEDGHSVWVNSKALERCGITKNTPNPQGGVIERDPKTGEATGTLRDEAQQIIINALGDYSVEQNKMGILNIQKEAASYGLTGWTDVTYSANPVKAYRELDREGKLTANVRNAIVLYPAQGIDEQVNVLVKARAENNGGLFQVTQAKMFVDGVLEGHTAYLKEPYADKPGYRGNLVWELDKFNKIVTVLDKEKIQLHLHSIGDGATAIALDAIKSAADVNGKRDSRHIITHLQLLDPQDIPRMKDLGVVGVINPYWFLKDEYFNKLQVPFLGKQRAENEYPARSLFKAGVMIASASDYPVTMLPNPLEAIQFGATRCIPDINDLKQVLWPAEKASVKDWIASFTINAAYALRMEKETGSIEVGKSADLVILDKNILGISTNNIIKTKVVVTLFKGNVVYQDESFK